MTPHLESTPDHPAQQTGHTSHRSSPSLVIAAFVACVGLISALLPTFVRAQDAAVDNQTDDKAFVVAMSSFPRSVDPHYRSAQPDFNLAWNLYQPLLLDRPHAARTEFILAKDIYQTNPTTWEVILKQDILFHDGSPLTAVDVVHSFHRARNHPDFVNKTPPLISHLKNLVEIKQIDRYKVHIITKSPNINVIPQMGPIMIVKKPADGALGDKDSFNNGTNAIGTGPYRFERYTDSGDIEVTRNPHFAGDQPYIHYARFTYFENNADRLQAFVDGEVDLLEKLTPGDIEWLVQHTDLNISRTETHRLQFLMLYSGENSPFVFDKASGEPLKENPMSDVRVRRAIAKAIDKNHLVRNVIGIDASGVNGFVRPNVSTSRQDTNTYDPKTAQKLLAEAGYPDGFRLHIHGPNDRYILDEVILEELARMLSEVGIETTPITFPKKEFFAKRGEYYYSAFFAGLSYSNNATKLIESMYHTQDLESLSGSRNYSGISNPKIDQLVAKAEATLNAVERRVYQRQLTTLALEQATVVPLYFEPSIWGVHKNMEYRPNPFEHTLAKDVLPAKIIAN